MTDKLVELVRQRKVLYDATCQDYKNKAIRNAAWEEIAKILNEPAYKCKENWSKLRNSFASALKRRRKKRSEQSTPYFLPWKYEDKLRFLLPYMDYRKRSKTTFESPSVATDDPSENPPPSPSSTHSVDSSVKIKDAPESPSIVIEDPNENPLATSPCSTRSCERFKFEYHRSSDESSNKSQQQNLYGLIEPSNDLRCQEPSRHDNMDDIDLFFLSMSKAVKALPKLEQIKIKLSIHRTVSQAEVRQLRRRKKI